MEDVTNLQDRDFSWEMLKNPKLKMEVEIPEENASGSFELFDSDHTSLFFFSFFKDLVCRIQLLIHVVDFMHMFEESDEVVFNCRERKNFRK